MTNSGSAHPGDSFLQLCCLLSALLRGPPRNGLSCPRRRGVRCDFAAALSLRTDDLHQLALARRHLVYIHMGELHNVKLRVQNLISIKGIRKDACHKKKKSFAIMAWQRGLHIPSKQRSKLTEQDWVVDKVRSCSLYLPGSGLYLVQKVLLQRQ